VSQLFKLPERLESALLLLAPRYDTPDMIIKVINARIRQKHSPSSRRAQRVTPSARIFSKDLRKEDLLIEESKKHLEEAEEENRKLFEEVKRIKKFVKEAKQHCLLDL